MLLFHPHLKPINQKKNLKKVSLLSMWIRQTSGYELLSVQFPCKILVIPGMHDITEQEWDYSPPKHQGLWNELQKLQQNIDLLDYVFTVLQATAMGSQCRLGYDLELKQK